MKAEYKTILITLSILAVSIMILTSFVYADESDFSYKADDSGEGIIITGYKGSDTDITIPSTIDGHNVIGLAAELFYNNEAIESIVIPDGVKTIGEGAFSGCSNLKSINIPEGITYLSKNLLISCINLEKVYIPESVTVIGENAFYGCKRLKEVKLPDGVSEIKAKAFYMCEELETVNVPKSLRTLGDSVFYACDKLRNIMDFYPDVNFVVGLEYKPAKKLKINGGYWDDERYDREADDYVKCDPWYEYESPSPSSNDKYILTFRDGSKLEIKYEDFDDEDDFQSYSLNRNLWWEEEQTYENQFKPGETHYVVMRCYNYMFDSDGTSYELFSVTAKIPVVMPEINETVIDGIVYSYSKDTSRAYIEYPLDKKALPSELNIPGKIEVDGKEYKLLYALGTPFEGCENIVSLKFSSPTSKIEDFCNLPNLTSVELPDSLKTIGSHSFAHCINLAHIDIPKGVTVIDNYAFYNTGLKSVDLPSGLSKVGYFALGYHSKNNDPDRYDEIVDKSFVINAGLNTIGTRYAIDNGLASAEVKSWIKKAKTMKVSMKAVASKGGKAKISYTKKSIASGYDIYRATKKTGKYKLVKTMKAGAKAKWTDKKLKKGKKYFYKIAPYKNIGKRKYHGKYSKIVTVKAR